MSRLTFGLIALALAVSTGCRNDRGSVRQAGEPVGSASRAATIVSDSSGRTAVSALADAARAGCAAVAMILRDAAKAIGDSSSAIGAPRDTTTTIGAPDGSAPDAACVLTWRDSTSRAAPLQDIYARLERSGWQQRPRLFDAGGPDGDALAFSRAGTACVVSGAWDGDDDSDSTYVPAPGFTIEATCSRDRPDPR